MAACFDAQKMFKDAIVYGKLAFDSYKDAQIISGMCRMLCDNGKRSEVLCLFNDALKNYEASLSLAGKSGDNDAKEAASISVDVVKDKLRILNDHITPNIADIKLAQKRNDLQNVYSLYETRASCLMDIGDYSRAIDTLTSQKNLGAKIGKSQQEIGRIVSLG
jgi:tetratricopeptide (TPR) repeat protein